MSLLREVPLVSFISPGNCTDTDDSAIRSLLEIISAAVSAKLPLIQIREKQLSVRKLFGLTTDAVRLAANSSSRIIVNQRFDLALAAGAAGVHLPSNSYSASDVRKSVGDEFLIGVSTHSRDEVVAARDAGADYAFYGPVFDTPGKGEPVGLERYRDIAKEFAPFPVLALGGVDRSNVVQVLESGPGFAAIRLLNDADDLRTIAELIKF